MTKPPAGANRCGAYGECAYWALGQYVSPDGKTKIWLCSNCCRLYKLDGYTLMHRFEGDSDCVRCGAYGPNEEGTPCPGYEQKEERPVSTA